MRLPLHLTPSFRIRLVVVVPTFQRTALLAGLKNRFAASTLSVCESQNTTLHFVPRQGGNSQIPGQPG
jgi:hypothetical protein